MFCSPINDENMVPSLLLNFKFEFHIFGQSPVFEIEVWLDVLRHAAKNMHFFFPPFKVSRGSFFSRNYTGSKKKKSRIFLDFSKPDVSLPFSLLSSYFSVDCPIKSCTRAPHVCSEVNVNVE